jgi:hypothetical protein
MMVPLLAVGDEGLRFIAAAIAIGIGGSARAWRLATWLAARWKRWDATRRRSPSSRQT